jgi:hypothetical protein
MIAGDPRQDPDMIVVEHDSLAGMLLGVHDGAGDAERFGQELQGVLSVLDDPVPQQPDPLREGGVREIISLGEQADGTSAPRTLRRAAVLDASSARRTSAVIRSSGADSGEDRSGSVGARL